MPDKVFCDPVHRHIVFDKDSDAILLDLIACPEVQRLRRIRQLGVSSYTFPGAEHSRFGHALGACHMMTQALDALARNQPELGLDDEVRLAARCAALLHDVGHGPFSHLTERICGFKHGRITTDVIQGASEVNAVLRGHASDLPGLVASLLSRGETTHPFLTDLLDSNLDVDRMDFLLRDAAYCGVSFGLYDYLRILHTLRIEGFVFDGQKHPIWLDKGKHSIEHFLYARFHMYWTVYYHKTTRGFESLFQKVLERAKELGKDAQCLPGIDRLLATTPDSETVLGTDDNLVLAQIALWRQSNDHILADLSRRFLSRSGFKPIGPVRLDPDRLGAVEDATTWLEGKGFAPAYYLLHNTRETTAYDYYRPEEETEELTSQTSITLMDNNGRRTEIAHALRGVAALSQEVNSNTFYYVPREEEAKLGQILAPLRA